MKQIGEYIVLRELGRGGMGAVYEAQERLSRRAVALKVMHGNIAASPRGRALFVGEMGILAKVDHPNVVRLLACLEDQGQLVMVLELLRGETLGQALRRLRRFAWTDAVLITRQILSGLAAAHGQQPPVVHRDLKPANVMLTEEGIVKVMDFGIAKVVHGETNATADVGTLQYMPPEQIDGGAIDARADLYAAGLVLYEMLAGAPPFRSNSTRELLQAQCTAPVPPLPPEVAGAVPQDLVEIMHLLLAKSPADRPGSAEAALRMLQSLGGTDTLSFRPTMPASPEASRGPAIGSPTDAAPAGSFPGGSQWDGTLGPVAPAAPTGGMQVVAGAAGASQWQHTVGPAAPTGGSFPGGGSQWGASQPGTHGGSATGTGFPTPSVHPSAPGPGHGQPISGPGSVSGPSFGHGHRVAPTKPRTVWPWLVGGAVLLFVGVPAAAMFLLGTTGDETASGTKSPNASNEAAVATGSKPKASPAPPSSASRIAPAPAPAPAPKSRPESEPKPAPQPDAEPKPELGILPDDGAELRLVDPPSPSENDRLGPVAVFDAKAVATEITSRCRRAHLSFINRYGAAPTGAISPSLIDEDTVEDIVLQLSGGGLAALVAISGRTFEPIWLADDLPSGELTRAGQLLLYATKRELRGLDIRSGHQRWSTTLSDRVGQVGLGADGEDLFVVTVDAKLHRVNPQDGTIAGAPTPIHPRTLGPIPDDTPRLRFGPRRIPDTNAPRLSSLTRGNMRCAQQGIATAEYDQRCLGGEVYGIYEASPGTPHPFAVGLRDGEELWRTKLFDRLERFGTGSGESISIGGPFAAFIKADKLAVVSRSDGRARWQEPLDVSSLTALDLFVTAERVYVIDHCPVVLDVDDATLLSPWGQPQRFRPDARNRRHVAED